MLLRLSILAFYATAETEATLRTLQQDRRLMRSRVMIHPDGIQGAARYLAENQSAQLMIVETTETGDDLFKVLESLAEVCGPEDRVILIGSENDISIYKRLLDMGIEEYLHEAVTTEQLMAQIERMFADEDAAAMGRIIGFIGARGGVGSSSIAVNTAYNLAREYDEDVLLIDLDLAFGTAALSLNLNPVESVAAALDQPDRLDEVLMERFMTRVEDHFSVVAAPADLNGFSEPSFESFEALIRLGSRMASFVVLDLPHQWARWVHDVLLLANDVVITAYPDLANLRDAKHFFENLVPRRGTEAPTRLVFNCVGRSKRTELSAKDFEGAMNVTPSAAIPYNPGAFGAVLQDGELLSKGRKGGGGVGRELLNLARLVSGRQPAAKSKSPFSLFRRSK